MARELDGSGQGLWRSTCECGIELPIPITMLLVGSYGKDGA
jgi:hypothetical protein